MAFREIDPKELTGNPFERIGSQWMLVTAGDQNRYNTMTASWGGLGVMWGKNVAYTVIRPQRYTYEFMESNDTYTLSFYGKEYKTALNFCGSKSGRDVDKFAETRLTPQKSRYVKAPGIEESPVNIECKVVEVKELGSHDMFIAKVMGVTVDERYMNDKGKFNLNASGLVTYSHGEYFELGKRLGSFGYSVKRPAKKRGPGNRGAKTSGASGGAGTKSRRTKG